MSLEWYEVVGCCGRIKLKVLALVITYINMVVCIIYLVLALVLCILLNTADVTVKKLSSMTVDSVANLVHESAIEGIIGGETIKDDTDFPDDMELPPHFITDMKNIANGITGGGGKGTGSIGWRILLAGQPVIARCRSGEKCKIKYTGSIRNRWEMGVVGIKGLLTFKLTLGNVKKLGLLSKHMILVATMWSFLLAVHLLFIVVLVTGLNQENQILVKAYCFFGVVFLSLLIIMFLSHAAICSVFPVYYLLHICLYSYSLLVIIAYIAEQHNYYGEEVY